MIRWTAQATLLGQRYTVGGRAEACWSSQALCWPARLLQLKLTVCAHTVGVQVMHVGDRFTASGNDSAVRDCCSILWVANPEETDFFVRMLLSDIEIQAAEKNALKSAIPHTGSLSAAS